MAPTLTSYTPAPLNIFQDAVVSEHSKTFVFHGEDHTLGNALRYVLMRNPDTEFCGYTVPHPSEEYMHLRLQTRPSIPADEVMVKGAATLKEMCMHIMKTYDAALDSSDE